MTKVAALNEEKGKNGLLQEQMDLVSYIDCFYRKTLFFIFLPFSKQDKQVIFMYARDICGILSMP